MNLPKFAALAAGKRAREVGPIGCELGDDKVALVQLETQRDEIRLLACAHFDFSDPVELKQRLDRNLRSHGFRSRRVVACLPPEQVKLVVVNYKPAPGLDEVTQILELLNERVPDSLDECVVDYRKIRSPEASEEVSVLVAIAREADAVEHLERLRRAGLHADGLEVGALAISRLAAYACGRARAENALIINLGEHHSEILILWGRRLILYRSIDCTEHGAVEQLSEGLGIDRAAAATLLSRSESDREVASADATAVTDTAIRRTVTEILRSSFEGVAKASVDSLAYATSRMRGESIDRAYLMGAGCDWTGLTDVMQPLLPVPLEALRPTDSLQMDASPADFDSRFNTAAGLALRGFRI